MAICRLRSMLDLYAEDYLVVEINHLFVSSTLREEIWLLQKKNDADLLRQMILNARRFDIDGIGGDRNFDTYSGGQKAILACLLMTAAISDHDIRDLRILLINVLESISGQNRRMLIAEFRQLRISNGIRVFTAGSGQVEQLEELTA